ncbi:MAG: hypothetical protein PHF51_05215 [Candidatus ainarchaeum sp.]|nr:hypothetical protein [Candidatus ainarchaeum sp.]
MSVLHPTVIPQQSSEETRKAEALKRMNSDVSNLLADIRAMRVEAEHSKDQLPGGYPAMLEKAETIVGNFAFVEGIERGKRQLPPAQKE